MSQWGTPQPCNEQCEHYFELGLDDDLKFNRNTQSYGELIHEAVGLAYNGEPYRLYVDDASVTRARSMFERSRRSGSGAIVGLNTGAGQGFANKSLSAQQWMEVADELYGMGFSVVLLGGPGEAGTNAWIVERLGDAVCQAGCEHSEQQFTAIVDQCDIVVTGDTFALHVALARDVNVVALFGPTCSEEIDLFGLGRKIVSPCQCGPCYRGSCDRSPNCMDMISPSQIVEAVQSISAERRLTIDDHSDLASSAVYEDLTR